MKYQTRKQINLLRLKHREGMWLRRIKFWKARAHLFQNHRIKRKQIENPEWGSW